MLPTVCLHRPSTSKQLKKPTKPEASTKDRPMSLKIPKAVTIGLLFSVPTPLRQSPPMPGGRHGKHSAACASPQPRVRPPHAVGNRWGHRRPFLHFLITGE